MAQCRPDARRLGDAILTGKFRILHSATIRQCLLAERQLLIKAEVQDSVVVPDLEARRLPHNNLPFVTDARGARQRASRIDPALVGGPAPRPATARRRTESAGNL